MLYKACRCGKIIPQTQKLCSECEEHAVSRHVIYNKTRRDPRAEAFYNSKAWKAMRIKMINIFDNVDIYALYVNKEILPCDRVHHIVELEDDWERRLDPFNLIPLNQRTHNTITSLYKQSESSMIATQKTLNAIILRHFNGAGEYQKVLCNAFKVAPPIFRGENSPREFLQE